MKQLTKSRKKLVAGKKKTGRRGRTIVGLPDEAVAQRKVGRFDNAKFIASGGFGKTFLAQTPPNVISDGQLRTISTKRRDTVALVLLEETIVAASAVLGSRDEAMRWLGTPVRALDFATPISLLGTKTGAAQVNDVLGQIAHGIW